MNIYFLVEGRRTEMKVYPKWLSILIPQLTRVNAPSLVNHNNFYLFSGYGFPSLLHNHLSNSVADINEINNFNYLVLCLDADECSVEERENEIKNFILKKKISLSNEAKLVIIIQNKCIETWMLGNKKIFKKNPGSKELKEYIDFYDVSRYDPEFMEKMSEFENSAQFHEIYLREMLAERNISYTKTHPRGVTEKPYLDQLIIRSITTGHIPTFSNFLSFCNSVREKMDQ